MRIGILTYHGVPNFGAQLQTLSTVCYLRNAGHDPLVLNWSPQDLENMYKWIDIAQRKAHDEYASRYLPMSYMCRNEVELLEEIDRLQLDAILLGSDALFKYIPILKRCYLKMGKRRPRIIFVKVPSVERLHDNPFFGSFIPKMKKQVPVSVYAVSSQNAHFDLMTLLEKRLMKSYMSSFQFISVRDEWTKKMVETITGVANVDVYPDPVFAFNENVSSYIPTEKEIREKFNISGRYMLLSFRTGECTDEYIQSIAREVHDAGCQPIALAMPEGVYCGGIKPEISIPLSPMDWYALIKYSSGYIGERMHPIVVALHNAVPCFAFDEYGSTMPERVIFPRIGKWDKEKSKIYHIMHAAGGDANWYAYGSKEPLPLPSYVVDRVVKCDKQKSLDFAQKQTERYNEGMKKILLSFMK